MSTTASFSRDVNVRFQSSQQCLVAMTASEMVSRRCWGYFQAWRYKLRRNIGSTVFILRSDVFTACSFLLLVIFCACFYLGSGSGPRSGGGTRGRASLLIGYLKLDQPWVVQEESIFFSFFSGRTGSRHQILTHMSAWGQYQAIFHAKYRSQSETKYSQGNYANETRFPHRSPKC